MSGKPPNGTQKVQSRRPYGVCHICGVQTYLTFEHVPPRKAFNSTSLLSAKGADLFTAVDPELARKSTLRKGAGDYTLCEPCNNFTGAMYGPAYIDWAHQGARYWNNVETKLALPFFLFPLRVAKQIISMFASTCGHGFFDKNPQLRKFVLDREARGLPEDIRLYCYMLSRDSDRSRSTGVVSQLTGSKIHVYAETSFVPFGYILALNSPSPDPSLMDITFFTHHGWNDWRGLHIKVPRRPVHTYFPGDFRSKEEWAGALGKSRSPIANA